MLSQRKGRSSNTKKSCFKTSLSSIIHNNIQATNEVTQLMNNNSLRIICIATLLSFHSNHYYLATLRIQFAAIILHKNNLTTLIAATMVKDSRYMNASRYGTNRGKIRFVCRENLSTLMKHKIAHLNLRESPVNVMLEEPLRWCLVK